MMEAIILEMEIQVMVIVAHQITTTIMVMEITMKIITTTIITIITVVQQKKITLHI